MDYVTKSYSMQLYAIMRLDKIVRGRLYERFYTPDSDFSDRGNNG